MIDKVNISKLATEFLDGSDKFLCDVQIKQGNIITIVIDSDTHVSIEDCIHLSKSIESKLDRETEDFDLRVSSFGADKPLKFQRQYQKNIGRQVEITTIDDQKISGILKMVDGENLKIAFLTKKKTEAEDFQFFPFKDIKEARVVLKFK